MRQKTAIWGLLLLVASTGWGQERPVAFYEGWGPGTKLRVVLWKETAGARREVAGLGTRLVAGCRQELTAAGYGALEIDVVEDYRTLREVLVTGDAAVVECDSGVYAELHANNRVTTYRVRQELAWQAPLGCAQGVIYVRRDSPFHEVRDLAGQWLAVADRQAQVAGRTQLQALNEAGVDPGKHLRVVECGTELDALQRLLTGIGGVAAAAVSSHSPAPAQLQRLLQLQSIAGLPIRRLLETDCRPGQWILYQDQLPPPAQTAIARLLEKWWGASRLRTVTPP